VNQPGTLILSIHLDSVWISESGTIQTLPKLKSLVQPEQPSVPYISETLVGVSQDAILNYFPDDERLIPISTELKLGIHELPKGMELSDNISIPFQPQDYNQLGTLNGIPDIKNRSSAVLKIFPISIDGESISWFADVTIQLTWNPEDPSFTPVLLSMEGIHSIQPRYTAYRAMNQIPDYQYSQNIAKIVVDSTGWYRITRSDLETHGVVLNNADPETFQLWNEEDEILLFIEGEHDGEFNDGDEIIFRGEKNPSPVNAPYQNNFYTDENVYWLTWGNQDGLRYGQENAYPSEDLPDWQKPIYFTQTVHIEKDEYFSRLGLVSDQVHQQWDGIDHFFMNPPVHNGTSVDYVIQLEHPATNKFQITAEVQGITSNTHLITMQWNENLIGETNTWEGQSIKQIHGESTENSSIPIYNGENLFTLINQENPIEGSDYDQVYLNWVDISYERFFKTNSEYIHFSTEPNQSGIMEFLLRGFNSNNIYLFKKGIARLQDFLIIEDDISQTFSIRFQDNIISPGTEYHIFSNIAIDTVKKIIPIEPINTLLDEIMSAYIIVAPDSFHTILEPLAGYHNGTVVSIDEIYRQYSYG
ncbi:uncharacterized protein METZ01_LOCUS175273, partial [marine metagenome]